MVMPEWGQAKLYDISASPCKQCRACLRVSIMFTESRKRYDPQVRRSTQPTLPVEHLILDTKTQTNKQDETYE
jgi:hypothetical protein